MARPCKSANLLTKPRQTKEEISAREATERKMRGHASGLKPPAFLSEDQKKIFKNIVKMLKYSEILGEPDVYILTTCAVAVDRLQKIEELLNRSGDWTKERDALSAKDKYTRDFFRCCNELSLSPQSRAKIGNLAVQKEKEAGSRLFAVLNGGLDKG